MNDEDNEKQEQLITLHGQMLNRINFLQSQKLSLIAIIPSLLIIVSFGYTYLASIQQELPYSVKIIAMIIVCFMSFGASIHNFNSMFVEKKEVIILEYFRLDIDYFSEHREKYPGLYGASLQPRKKEQYLFYKRSRTYLSVLYSLIGGFSVIPLILEMKCMILKEILAPIIILTATTLIFLSSFYCFFSFIYKSADELARRKKTNQIESLEEEKKLIK